MPCYCLLQREGCDDAELTLFPWRNDLFPKNRDTSLSLSEEAELDDKQSLQLHQVIWLRGGLQENIVKKNNTFVWTIVVVSMCLWVHSA